MGAWQSQSRCLLELLREGNLCGILMKYKRRVLLAMPKDELIFEVLKEHMADTRSAPLTQRDTRGHPPRLPVRRAHASARSTPDSSASSTHAESVEELYAHVLRRWGLDPIVEVLQTCLSHRDGTHRTVSLFGAPQARE
jgi:hypothetical protein